MIVTAGGKNIYPEDIEASFDGIAVKEYCIFAANYIWPTNVLGNEKLVMILHLDINQNFTDSTKSEIESRNQNLPDFKRVAGYVLWDKDFPRTASMKIKRNDLAEEIRNSVHPSTVKGL